MENPILAKLKCNHTRVFKVTIYRFLVFTGTLRITMIFVVVVVVLLLLFLMLIMLLLLLLLGTSHYFSSSIPQGTQ